MSDLSDKDLSRTLFSARLTRFAWGAFFFPSSMVFGFELLRIAYQSLRNGTFDRIYFDVVAPEPQVSWVGVQSAISFIWSLPLIFVALMIAVLTQSAWMKWEDRVNELERKLEATNRGTAA